MVSTSINSNRKLMSILRMSRRIQHPGRWLFLAVIAVIVLAFLFGGDGIWSTLMVNRRVTKLEARIDSLESLNQRMQERIEGLQKKDPQVLEEEARSHGMIKPGERVYVMQPGKERKKK